MFRVNLGCITLRASLGSVRPCLGKQNKRNSSWGSGSVSNACCTNKRLWSRTTAPIGEAELALCSHNSNAGRVGMGRSLGCWPVSSLFSEKPFFSEVESTWGRHPSLTSGFHTSYACSCTHTHTHEARLTKCDSLYMTFSERESHRDGSLGRKWLWESSSREEWTLATGVSCWR